VIPNSILLASLSPIKRVILGRSISFTSYSMVNIDVNVVVFASIPREMQGHGRTVEDRTHCFAHLCRETMLSVESERSRFMTQSLERSPSVMFG
jgi:hypothetical protein